MRHGFGVRLLRVTAMLCAVALLCAPAAGCASVVRTNAPLSRTDFALDTTVTVTLYGTQEEALLGGCFDRIGQYERLFSRTWEGGDVWRINHAGGAPTEVSPATCELLRLALEMGEKSGGAFDVTIAPASSLWDFTAADPVVPSGEALAAAAARVDYRRVTADTQEGTVTLSGDGTAIDLGGIAKGYIADRLADYLAENGVDSALLDLGGNIYVLGKKSGRPWRVGIRDPKDPQGLAAMVEAENASVVTSGVYERAFTVDGVVYHHILDPATGKPVRNGLASVTIVSDKSADGDALSTACFVLGEDAGMRLVESLAGVEALFIREDGTLAASKGLVYEEK